MPRYNYRCEKCESEMMLTHGMKEKVDTCPECGNSESFNKLVQKLEFTKNEQHQKPGSIVESFIKDAKEQVEHEKKKLKSRDIK